MQEYVPWQNEVEDYIWLGYPYLLIDEWVAKQTSVDA
jgi:hypothetical protein